MIAVRCAGAALAAMLLVSPAQGGLPPLSGQDAAAELVVTVETGSGAKHRFNVEVARTSAQQARGLMFRTNIPPDGGMLFAPYPGDGGPPREASFWMVNTPTPLDVIFIRADGTIARIIQNAEPFSDERLRSGEPVGAVLEIHGGRSAELGIAAGDRVSWPGRI